MMKLNPLYIMPWLLAMVLTACADDDLLNPGAVDGEKVYALELAIGGEASRSTTSNTLASVTGVKTHWCYGDQVVLTQESDNSKYVFTIPVTSGHQKGDEVEGGKARFVCPSTVPNFNNFTGTVAYAPTIETVDNGIVIVDNASGVSSLGNKGDLGIEIKCDEYALQKYNNDTKHLKCLPLSAQLTNANLSESKVITLKRNYSIFKIVLDDFYYPIYGGSWIVVKGMRTKGSPSVDPYTSMVGMFLGDNILEDKTTVSNPDPDKFGLSEYSNTSKGDYLDPTGKNIFCGVSSQKRPFPASTESGYAVRDGNHNLVAFMVMFGDREILDGERIVVCLREQYSMDWYFWQTEPLKAASFPVGGFYALDFTKKVGNKYVYESYPMINMGFQASTSFGCFAIKNLGAENMTDPGDYYMFGYERAIRPGDLFPMDYLGYDTPYWFYKKVNNKDCFYYNGNGANFKDNGYQFTRYVDNNPLNGFQTYPEAETFLGNNALDKITLPETTANGRTVPELTQHPEAWWTTWIKGFKELPYIRKVPSMAAMTSVKNYVRYMGYKHLIRSDGAITTNPSEAVGVMAVSKRTKHAVFFPITGVLEPEEVTSRCVIPRGTRAQIKAGTENLAAFPSLTIRMPKATTEAERAFQCVILYYDTSMDTIPQNRQGYGLETAIPIRPTLKINNVELKQILQNHVPGLN